MGLPLRWNTWRVYSICQRYLVSRRALSIIQHEYTDIKSVAKSQATVESVEYVAVNMDELDA